WHSVSRVAHTCSRLVRSFLKVPRKISRRTTRFEKPISAFTTESASESCAHARCFETRSGISRSARNPSDDKHARGARVLHISCVETVTKQTGEKSSWRIKDR